MNPITTLPLRKLEIHKGPNHTDKSNTTLVVEGVPAGPSVISTALLTYPDKFNDSAVRAWFAQFGEIKSLTFEKSTKQVVLVYHDHDSASQAWNDPRPIFENRFVRVWWKKSEGTDIPAKQQDHPAPDLELVKEQARKAQIEHEEKQKRKLELEKKREELERQRVELLEMQKRERERLLEKVRRAKEKNDVNTEGSMTTTTPTATGEQVNGHSTDTSSRKEQLQKMLTDLQNQVSSLRQTFLTQANALNIPPSEYTLSDNRGKPTFRGHSYRSRSFRPRARGSSSRSLDLRPKAIQISNVLRTSHETDVREHLIMNYSNAITEPTHDSLIITFKERYEAEDVSLTFSIQTLI